jgi:hypothetical protein
MQVKRVCKCCLQGVCGVGEFLKVGLLCCLFRQWSLESVDPTSNQLKAMNEWSVMIGMLIV